MIECKDMSYMMLIHHMTHPLTLSIHLFTSLVTNISYIMCCHADGNGTQGTLDDDVIALGQAIDKFRARWNQLKPTEIKT